MVMYGYNPSYMGGICRKRITIEGQLWDKSVRSYVRNNLKKKD
jgi:hypothetical protein